MVDCPAVKERISMLRIEGDGLVIVSHTLIQISHVAVCNTAVVVGVGVLRVELDGCVKILDGVIQVAFI